MILIGSFNVCMLKLYDCMIGLFLYKEVMVAMVLFEGPFGTARFKMV